MRAGVGAMLALLVALATAACATACATATGEVHGGAWKLDAAPPETLQLDAGPIDDAGPPPEDLVDAGAGTTWTDLYRDLFGPTGQASCAGNATCHGAADQAGAHGSFGYVCATRDGCRESMLSLATGLVQAQDFDAPAESGLVAALRRRSARGTVVGTMPRTAPYVFSHDSIARIETWISHGAPAD